MLFVGLGEFLSMLMTAFGQAVSPSMILQFGWRSVMFACAVIGIILLLLIFWFLNNPPEFERIHTPVWSRFKTAWKAVSCIRNVWLAGLFSGGMFTVISVFGALWGNQYLQMRYGLTYLDASCLIALIPLGLALGSPLMGFLNERIFPNRPFIIVLTFLLLVTSFAMMFAGSSKMMLAVSLFLLGFFGGGNLLAFYIAEQSVPIKIRGIATGLCNALALLVGVIFQPMMGLIIEKSNIFAAMWVFPGVIFFAFLVSIALRYWKY